MAIGIESIESTINLTFDRQSDDSFIFYSDLLWTLLYCELFEYHVGLGQLVNAGSGNRLTSSLIVLNNFLQSTAGSWYIQ